MTTGRINQVARRAADVKLASLPLHTTQWSVGCVRPADGPARRLRPTDHRAVDGPAGTEASARQTDRCRFDTEGAAKTSNHEGKSFVDWRTAGSGLETASAAVTRKSTRQPAPCGKPEGPGRTSEAWFARGRALRTGTVSGYPPPAEGLRNRRGARHPRGCRSCDSPRYPAGPRLGAPANRPAEGRSRDAGPFEYRAAVLSG